MEDTGMLAAVMIAASGFIIGMLVSSIILVLYIIAQCKLYAKLGMPGGYGVIPFARWWYLGKRVSSRTDATWLTVLTVVTIVLSFVSGMLAGDAISSVSYYDLYGSRIATTSSGAGLVASNIMSILTTVASIALIVFEWRVYSKLAKGFGHGNGYTFGLVCLNLIFVCILAFSDNERFDERRLITPNQGQGYPQQPISGQFTQEYGQAYGQQQDVYQNQNQTQNVHNQWQYQQGQYQQQPPMTSRYPQYPPHQGQTPVGK